MGRMDYSTCTIHPKQSQLTKRAYKKKYAHIFKGENNEW